MSSRGFPRVISRPRAHASVDGTRAGGETPASCPPPTPRPTHRLTNDRHPASEAKPARDVLALIVVIAVSVDRGSSAPRAADPSPPSGCSGGTEPGSPVEFLVGRNSRRLAGCPLQNVPMRTSGVSVAIRADRMMEPVPVRLRSRRFRHLCVGRRAGRLAALARTSH